MSAITATAGHWRPSTTRLTLLSQHNHNYRTLISDKLVAKTAFAGVTANTNAVQSSEPLNEVRTALTAHSQHSQHIGTHTHTRTHTHRLSDTHIVCANASNASNASPLLHTTQDDSDSSRVSAVLLCLTRSHTELTSGHSMSAHTNYRTDSGCEPIENTEEPLGRSAHKSQYIRTDF